MDLVRQIGCGENREAEAALFRRMAPRVRLFGLRHLRDEAAADDLTQQVLIITLKALREGRLREPESSLPLCWGHADLPCSKSGAAGSGESNF